MHYGKINRGRIRRDRIAIITERIKGDGRADELRRGRIKDWIGLVQDAVESRGRHLLSSLSILKLTVAEPGVVSPAPVKQFVALDANGAQPSVSFVVEQTVTEISEPRPRAAGNDLLERVKGIERVSRNTGFRVGR